MKSIRSKKIGVIALVVALLAPGAFANGLSFKRFGTFHGASEHGDWLVIEDERYWVGSDLRVTFLSGLTTRDPADIKVGTIVVFDGKIRDGKAYAINLREVASMPQEDDPETGVQR